MNTIINNLMQYELWGNTGLQYIIAAGIIIFLYTLIRIILYVVIKKLDRFVEKSKTRIDNIILSGIRHLPTSTRVLLAIYTGISQLEVQQLLDQFMHALFVIVVGAQIGLMFVRMIKQFLEGLPQHQENPQSTTLITIIAKIVVWISALLLILNNLGVEIAPLITSLGIVGIAVGLALQNVLEDLFSAISIYLDKPFLVGDFIQTSSVSGQVKTVGLKTTRLTTIRGEEVVMSNRRLIDETISNYGHMQERTITDSIVLSHQTTKKQLLDCQKYIKDILDQDEISELNRCHVEKLDHQGYHISWRYTLTSTSFLVYKQYHERVILELGSYLQQNELYIGQLFPGIHT